MRRILVLCFLLSAHCSKAFAFDFNIISLRSTLSKPDTSQSLNYESNGSPEQKILYHLSPTNNERLGFFLDVNDIEIGYAVDVFKDDIETSTQNFLISYRKLKNSRITFNYQTLEGLNNLTENLSGEGLSTQFTDATKSTKLELFGQHNLYTFSEKESLFEHFFLNKPKLSHSFDWSLSIVGGWSVKRLSLEAPGSILVDVDFVNPTPAPVSKLDSVSYSADVGPFLSVSLPDNFHFFAEYKIGKGHIKNLNDSGNLKESGDEKARAIGAGLSWTSPNQKALVLLRAWRQEGRHIETSFGDLSFVWFF